MSAALRDLDIDWTGATVVVHGNISVDAGGIDVKCPCGWRRLIGETPNVPFPGTWAMPASTRAAHAHAAAHHGDVYCLVRNAHGDIVTEWSA